jgi:polar amino acid transport system substrate-binding protein
MTIFQKLPTLIAAGILAAMPALAETTLDKVMESGEVNIGIGNAPPWAGVDSDGKLVGAAPEIAVEVLKRMGIENVSPTIVDYGAMIPGLNAGRFDMVAAGMYIIPDRCNIVSYSEPDLCDAEAFVVPKGNPMQFTNYEDVVNHESAILIVCGGCGQEKAARDAGVPSERLLLINDEQNALGMLTSGRADVYSYPVLSANGAIRKGGFEDAVEVVAPLKGVPVGCGAAVFRKEDTTFRDAYDAKLAEIKADGSFAKILDAYNFSTEFPTQTSRGELCGDVAN